jgi:hypothetical protein
VSFAGLKQVIASEYNGARVSLAIELDAAHEAGVSIERYLLRNKAAREQMREALEASGGAGTDTNFVSPIFSVASTIGDVVWFVENPQRAHLIREAVEGERVLAGRTSAGHLVVVRQLFAGFRQLVVVAARRLIISPDTKISRLQDADDVLSWLFETATRSPESDAIYIDEILLFVDEQRSSAMSAPDSVRRLS